ncbi:unnamed protein product [Cochlearia groenlandica]
MESGYRCVGCGIRVKSLFIQYSPGNIRLMKCENCKEVADEYIECERMIIFIDLILHRPKVYRHVLFNAINQETVNVQHLLWKLVLAYLMLDSYRSLLLRQNNEESSSFLISLKVIIGVVCANAAFIFSFAIAAKGLLNKVSSLCRKREILLGILISTYFKIFLLSMLVWEFPMSVIFIVDLLVLTSNSMALQVLTESTTSRSIGVCLIAHTARFLVGHLFEPTTFFTQFGSLM